MGNQTMLSDILRDLEPMPSAYLSAARRIETGTFDALKPVNVGVLSTFTSDILRPYIIVESAVMGLLARSYFAPFNQFEQQVFDSSSRLYESSLDFVVFAMRLEEIAPRLVTRFMALSSGDIDSELRGIEGRLQSLVEGVRRSTKATVLVFNFAGPDFLAAGLADSFLESSQASVIQRANESVASICRKLQGVYVFDYARAVYDFGLRHWYDPKLWHLGRIPFGVGAQIEMSRWLARYLRAICFPPCKCLVVDLDNTLWGGVLGEDGLGGIALGEDYPGNVYKNFQRRLLSLQDRGVLLAVASKNNENDVLEVFRKHPDCVLKAEDFAALQIGWQDKATSLTAISKELNIGTDALAFFDDSPVEREWIRSQMPEVTVIEVPKTPLGFAHALDKSGAFDLVSISAEDRKRAEMYQREQERKQLQTHSTSLEEFLERLDITATIGRVDPETLPRVTQLIAKTNQFNLTTRRYTPSEFQTIIDSGAVALWLRVADRFGDNGLVGVAVAVPENAKQWLIDTFLLSCRVIGRQVETALLSLLLRQIQERGGRKVIGEYISTAKNRVAAEFYQKHGFDRADDNGKRWVLGLATENLSPPQCIKVNFLEGRDTKVNEAS